MVEHFRLALGMGKERLRWKLQKLDNAPVTRVILCTYDKPGLFSKMVGLFTLHNIGVLSGNIFTLKNGLALTPMRSPTLWIRFANRKCGRKFFRTPGRPLKTNFPWTI
jgi:hypothetical protein